MSETLSAIGHTQRHWPILSGELAIRRRSVLNR